MWMRQCQWPRSGALAFTIDAESDAWYSLQAKPMVSRIMDQGFMSVQKAGTSFLYVYFQGSGFLGVSIFMGTV